MKKRVTVTLVFLVFILAVFAAYFGFYGRESSDINVRTSAANGSATLTSQAEWEAGTLDNIDSTTTPGDMEIDEKGNADIDGGTFSGTSCAAPRQYPEHIHDGDLNTVFAMCPGNYVEWDFGESKTISEIRTFIEEIDTDPYTCIDLVVQYWDGITWVEMYVATAPVYDWEIHYISPSINTNKIKFYLQMNPPGSPEENATFRETMVLSSARATHTTAPTQIDGQEGSADKEVIEWTSFTPTQTTPANTSITYEFRTSADGSSWTDWSAPQSYSGSPLDLTTLTPNRYLQVRATLINTDGVSTPQIDDYTINFHNNLPPNAPTAETVIIGE